jgi:hypothetical protein
MVLQQQVSVALVGFFCRCWRPRQQHYAFDFGQINLLAVVVGGDANNGRLKTSKHCNKIPVASIRTFKSRGIFIGFRVFSQFPLSCARIPMDVIRFLPSNFIMKYWN